MIPSLRLHRLRFPPLQCWITPLSPLAHCLPFLSLPQWRQRMSSQPLEGLSQHLFLPQQQRPSPTHQSMLRQWKWSPARKPWGMRMALETLTPPPPSLRCCPAATLPCSFLASPFPSLCTPPQNSSYLNHPHSCPAAPPATLPLPARLHSVPPTGAAMPRKRHAGGSHASATCRQRGILHCRHGPGQCRKGKGCRGGTL